MNQNGALLAFLIEGPPGGVPGAQETVVLGASPSEMGEKIAEQVGCPGASVTIVNPSEWNPPPLSEISDAEIEGKATWIFDRIVGYVVSNGISMDMEDMANGGAEIRNPVSGKVFFVFKSL